MYRFVFTGAPGSGKTTVLNYLMGAQYEVIPEAATSLIMYEQSQGSPRPWEKVSFLDKCIDMQIQRQCNAQGTVQLYDRSPFCTYALALYFNRYTSHKVTISKNLRNELNRCCAEFIYQKEVFFFDLPDTIQNTPIRTISHEQAVIFEHIHREVYRDFGFLIISVPWQKIVERAQSIQNVILNRVIHP